MMSKANYQNDLMNFWKYRKEAREESDKKIAELTFSEKIAITEKLLEKGKSLIGLKNSSIAFDLHSPDAMTELSSESLSNKEEFNNLLYIEFPFEKNDTG